MPEVRANRLSYLTKQYAGLNDKSKQLVDEAIKKLEAGHTTHSKQLAGTGSEDVCKRVGLKMRPTVYEIGYSGEWRVFYYKTGYSPRQTAEAAAKKGTSLAGFATLPDGVVWCVMLGHFDKSGLNEPNG